MKSIPTALLMWLTAAASADDSCVRTLDWFAQGAATTIGLTFGSDVAPDVVYSAIEMWGDCDEYSTGFPSFQTGTNGDVSISVVSSEGYGTRGCGRFDPIVNGSNQVTGGTITLFAMDINGTSCAGQLTESLAHELGHVLGLDDAENCSGYVMGPPSSSYARSVQQSECDKAEDNWLTDGECLDVNDNGVCDIWECEDANGNGLCDTNEPLDKDPNEDSCPGGAPCSSPLLVNLRGGRWDLAGPDHSVYFDIDGDGGPNRITWTERGSAIAFLAIDLNANSYIESGAELFGNWTLLTSGRRARNGFEALMEFDSNGDGVVTAEDARWSSLLLWIDTNHDGISQLQELRSISTTPISALGTRHQWTGRRDRHGNFFGYRSLVTIGGVRRPYYDVYFRSVP